jgi:hypothetical protein
MDAAYTPRTIMNLESCIFKENQAYFKNKSVLNSQGVYFGITRQHCRRWAQKHNYFWLQKSSKQILQKWKTIFRKRFTA